MPDSVTSSSKVAVQLHAPGGISLGTVQDTSQYSVETLVSIFGTNNIRSVNRAVTQNVSNVVTTQDIAEISVSTRQSSSFSNGVTKQTIIPTITALSERLQRTGRIMALYTASRSEPEAAEITGSTTIVLDPIRQLSADRDIQTIYTETASYDDDKPLERKVDLVDYLTHKEKKEPEFTAPFTHSVSSVDLSDYSYDGPSEAITDSLNVNKKYTKYYIFDDVLYTDDKHTNVFNGGGHRYFNVSGSVPKESWGITSKGKSYYKYNQGNKEKPKFKHRLLTSTISEKLEGVCVDGDTPSFAAAYWYDKDLYKDENLVNEYIFSSSAVWVKSITWDEALLISGSSGRIIDSQPC